MRHDPRDCWRCRLRARVIDIDVCDGYIRRRYRCPGCAARWTDYQSRMNPRKQLRRVFKPAQVG
jgi:hypothetical protein